METQEITNNVAKQDALSQFQKLAEGLNNWPTELFADSEVVIVYRTPAEFSEADDILVLEPGEDPAEKLKRIRDAGGIPVGVFFASRARRDLYKLVDALSHFLEEKGCQWKEERKRREVEAEVIRLALEVGIDEPHAKAFATKFVAHNPLTSLPLLEDDNPF